MDARTNAVRFQLYQSNTQLLSVLKIGGAQDLYNSIELGPLGPGVKMG